MGSKNEQERRRAERTLLQSEVILFVDTTKSESVDVSDTGICLVTEQPIMFNVLRNNDGKIIESKAQLAWVNKTGDRMVYGLEYIEKSE
ncbi:MAG: PilZ domain-containing protein [Candidatus Marinimicrobia bacterium]|nr:PilZ domain-containing protein [Candidatus Neomarinimicrobiota bacterium]MBL7023514.1 PilZ domain-containing protein [Candidatus Neomarinimicrobiota bacterium]